MNFASSHLDASENQPEAIAQFLKEMLNNHFQGHAILQEACDLSDSAMDQLYEKAYDHYAEGQGGEASHHFGLLIALNPFRQEYWMGLAASRQLAKDYDKALQAYAVAALLDDRDPSPHYHAAQCYLSLGNKADTLKALELAEAHASLNHCHAPLRQRIVTLKEAIQKPKGVGSC